ncbi:opacity protein-like surface antigen [Litorivivens lipolytica]|uniref:Opacity protein-like surface antigen n=1 Tax=Litorivivens lipolytica TaxID=1524264 RepID=A0A7W4W7J9_9GAMM|nr:outer membrane beta-barrel protein [Litorivivens lipolytica]MBB3048968.1 opacity protein-like surface antigen [Litorivivens lipolytica]
MKKLAIALLALSATAGSFAADKTGGFVGIKTGNMDIDSSIFDADAPLGIVFGYQGQSGAGVEVEYNRADVDFVINGRAYTADFKTLALYGTYRSEGDAYFKGKLGILREDLENDFVSMDDSGLSGGIGLGFRLGEAASLELEYTVIEEDVNYYSAGLNIHF